MENDGKSKVKAIGEVERPKNLSRNEYSDENVYGLTHPNALSDGDVKGKGLNNGSIGSSVDISQRKQSISRNKFNLNNIYRVTD